MVGYCCRAISIDMTSAGTRRQDHSNPYVRHETSNWPPGTAGSSKSLGAVAPVATVPSGGNDARSPLSTMSSTPNSFAKILGGQSSQL